MKPSFDKTYALRFLSPFASAVSFFATVSVVSMTNMMPSSVMEISSGRDYILLLKVIVMRPSWSISDITAESGLISASSMLKAPFCALLARNEAYLAPIESKSAPEAVLFDALVSSTIAVTMLRVKVSH